MPGPPLPDPAERLPSIAGVTADAAAAVAPRVVVHAGAGNWGAGLERGVAACERACAAGLQVLGGGGSALDAVLAAVRVLEDDPSCNAGTGAVTTSAGTIELDACVADGSTGRSGAVGALPPFRHPIDVARAVMDDGRHLLLVADGAARFARDRGFAPSTLEAMLVERAAPPSGNTVGAVAIDGLGRLAAGTSTGGMAGQAPGRLGDTPIVGAATYADERVACSWTGQGEAIARGCSAFFVSLHADRGAQGSADLALRRLDEELKGLGGLVALDAAGGVGVRFNTKAMPHGIGVLGEPVRTGS